MRGEPVAAGCGIERGNVTYSVDKGGYVVNIGKDRLERNRAPSFRRGEEPTWDADYDTRIRDYYR